MAKQLVIPHVSRIEGHAKITIDLDDSGNVVDARLHVTQLRGFEKFTEGRPYYEMPAITARICGICPVSHLLASVKACDQILAVNIPTAAVRLRELLHFAQFVQSHALSFFHLSAPDLLLGMDAAVGVRNVFGLARHFPDTARDGIALRKFGQDTIERLAGQRIHPAWTVPGGVNRPLQSTDRDAIRSGVPAALSIVNRALALVKGLLERFAEEAECFSNLETRYAALVGVDGALQLYDGALQFRSPSGDVLAEVTRPEAYVDYIGEAALLHSYLKAPYYKPDGANDGIYRVGPLARLNVCERLGTELADRELVEYRERLGRMPRSAFYGHYARLIEVLFCLEQIQRLIDNDDILSNHVRVHASVNAPRGVGIVEAPRGVLIHHYEVNGDGAITWANLIVATGHNNLAMGRGVRQVAERFIRGGAVEEGLLNRVSAVVRAYDPCLSCSTHAAGQPALEIDVRRPDGSLHRRLRSVDPSLDGA
ncbi:MAG: Ni/Fe hydrogenase subunit alpha [Polyangiaceae bacterium]